MSLFDEHSTDVKFSSYYKLNRKLCYTACFRARECDILLKYLDDLGERIVFDLHGALDNWVQENKEKIGLPGFKNTPFHKHTIEHPFEVFNSQAIAPPVHLHFETCSNGIIRLDVLDGRNVLIGVLTFACDNYLN